MIGSQLLSSMSVWIDGASCKISSVEMQTNFSAYTHMNSFKLSVSVPCTLKGKSETFNVQFNDLALIRDNGDNKLSTPLITARAPKYTYASAAEKAAVSTSGSAFQAVTLATFALVIVLSMLQSAAVGSFWIFVNMLQLLSYIPAIDCVFPYNLNAFLTQYMSVSSVSIPYSILPDWVPNLLSYLSDFVTEPFNSQFEGCGYESLSFIYNFADQLTTWLLVLMFYLLLRFLTWIVPVSK